jgi:DNA-binding transcriptional regulator GbsR (MarR family)
MSSDYTVKYPFIRIKKIDDLYSKHQKIHNETMCNNMDKEDKERLKESYKNLDNNIKDIQKIIHQTLDLLENNGCDVYKYIKPNALQNKSKEVALDKGFKAREQRELE